MQYSHFQFYYPNKKTKENANFRWEEPEAKQGSQQQIEAFLIIQKVKTTF